MVTDEPPLGDAEMWERKRGTCDKNEKVENMGLENAGPGKVTVNQSGKHLRCPPTTSQCRTSGLICIPRTSTQ